MGISYCMGGSGGGGQGPPFLDHVVGFLTLGLKLDPLLDPPFFACRPKMDPPPFQKSRIRPCTDTLFDPQCLIIIPIQISIVHWQYTGIIPSLRVPFKAFFLWKGEPPPECIPCECPLTIKRILIECADFNDMRPGFTRFPLYRTFLRLSSQKWF